MPPSQELIQILDRADDLRSRVGSLLSGEYPDDGKIMLLLAYLDVVCEHHEAMLHLIRIDFRGSAFALVRVLLEAFFRAHWVNFCASPDEVERIAQREFSFPGMQAMVDAIDTASASECFFAQIKQSGWKAMNSYTHTGFKQLSRRFRGTRVEPNYPDAEVLVLINVTTSAVIMLAWTLALSTNRTQAASQIEQIIQTELDSDGD